MEKKPQARPVKIETENRHHVVKFADRKKGGRHNAAVFYAPDFSLERVIEWVERNPKIYLFGDE